MGPSVEKDVPPRGRRLHAHLRDCAVQIWFQGVGPQDGDDAPQCTCDGIPPECAFQTPCPGDDGYVCRACHTRVTPPGEGTA